MAKGSWITHWNAPKNWALVLCALREILISFFLCKELIEGYLKGITGEYTPPSGYFIDEAKALRFDKQFPPKKKEKLPGQIFS